MSGITLEKTRNLPPAKSLTQKSLLYLQKWQFIYKVNLKTMRKLVDFRQLDPGRRR
jgi:hypothetical protein